MESPAFFRLSFNDQVKMNMLNYSSVPYKANTWYKVDLLMDWENEYAAMFLNG